MGRVENHIATYNRRFLEKRKNGGAFYCDDYMDIVEISKEESLKETLYNAIDNALKVGFIIGYNRAKKDAKKKPESKIRRSTKTSH